MPALSVEERRATRLFVWLAVLWGCSDEIRSTDASAAGSGGVSASLSAAGAGGFAGAAGSTAGAAGSTAGAAGSTAGAAGSTAGAAGSTAGAAAPFGDYGQATPAGKGGKVIRVTTLSADGPGSLREALSTSGPRIVIFEVGGVIDLNQMRLDVNEPFVTVAGQTAPSPGITLIRGGMRIFTHDVRIQHLRLRMGDAGVLPASGFEPDVTTDGASAYNIVFDHLSVAWGVDENLSVSGPRFNGPTGTSRNVSIVNSIIAEGLRSSVHEKGAHSMGTLIHDSCTGILVLGNLFAQNDERNPWLKGFATGAVVNNVIYNPGRWAIRLGPVDTEWAATDILPEGPRVSIVGNYLRHGANTSAGLAMVGSNSRGSAFLEDNIALDVSGASLPVVSPPVTVLAELPAWPEGLEARPAASVVDWVLAHSGARPRDRDPVDQRIVADVRAGKGMIIDSQEQVGGYPAPAPTIRTLTIPSDVDAWLTELARELE